MLEQGLAVERAYAAERGYTAGHDYTAELTTLLDGATLPKLRRGLTGSARWLTRIPNGRGLAVVRASGVEVWAAECAGPPALLARGSRREKRRRPA
jgi:hypothetical protein